MVPDYGPWASALTGVAVAAKEEPWLGGWGCGHSPEQTQSQC